MSKESVQIKAMMRHPQTMIEFEQTGRLPNAVQPSSPLITFLESLPPRERLSIVNVRLHPSLGYSTSAQFANASQLLNYLKPKSWMTGSWPAESYRIRNFNKRIDRALFDSIQERD